MRLIAVTLSQCPWRYVRYLNVRQDPFGRNRLYQWMFIPIDQSKGATYRHGYIKVHSRL